MASSAAFSITSSGQTGYSLLASGLGDTGGGLFAFDGTEFQTVDRVSTTGLFLSGDRLFRSLHTPGENSAGEILVYDSRGIERYYRVDALADSHDLIWDGSCFVAVSSARNSILWIGESGKLEREWRAPGEDDSWHLNGVIPHDGSLLVCAFGRYRRHREWKERIHAGEGVVFDFESGRDILTGLCAPHNPRYFDGAWHVCNSAEHELVRIDPCTGTVVRRIPLNSFTRGLALSDHFLFVGESAHRNFGQGQTASVAILNRRTWDLLGRVPLPCREIYDLVLAPEPLVEGVRNGFRTNPLRTKEQDQLQFFNQLGIAPTRIWATGDPLPPDQCRVSIEAEVPAEMAAGSTILTNCKITNLAAAFLVPAPPNPVTASYFWVASNGYVSHGERTLLPKTLLPKESLQLKVKVQAPERPGRYTLKITLVQELVAWFSDLDPGNVCSRQVSVY